VGRGGLVGSWCGTATAKDALPGAAQVVAI